MTMQVGTLIKVHTVRLRADGRTSDGPLWVVVGWIEEAGYHSRVHAKSLATGTRWVWLDTEYEEAPCRKEH